VSEVTVAVPVKDRREQMLRCLDALLAQDHPSYEILVCDNGSTDGTAEACAERARGAGVPVTVQSVPGVLGAVRNEAARLARTELVAYTDSDCLPSPGWLTAATRAIQADAGLGIVQGRTLPEVEVDQGWPATIRVESFSGLYEACNLIVRREAIVNSAGFDEVVGHFWEDTACGFAIRRKGWRAAFAPDALVYHDVTYPGYWWHVKRTMRNANLGPVLRQYPEMRRDVLFWRVFPAERDARFVFAIAGLALARRQPAALLLTLPYLQAHSRRRERWVLPRVKGHAQQLIYDAARQVAMARASWRGRTLLL
jgi:glycosyltransferase involved in cell wall biosynthesis